MRLLAATSASLLWLRADDPAVQANLRAAAQAAGVDAARLIFAPSVPEADHFARLAAADLFLARIAISEHNFTSHYNLFYIRARRSLSWLQQ
jgi:protein O-GlcNAc transferase